MSMGYCGKIEKFAEDEFTAIYRYCGENWNDDTETRGSWDNLDGEILIHKRCLVEPEIHMRMKKTSSGKKVSVAKKVPQPFNLGEAIRAGNIEIIKPCTSEYSKGVHLGIDRMYFAVKLLRKLFQEYQEQGTLPEVTTFLV